MVARSANQSMVARTISTPMISFTNRGVAGLITSVKRLRKKSVAFGFVTFVMKPNRMACRLVRSASLRPSARTSCSRRARSDLMPMYSKYAALIYFNTLNTTTDCAMMSAIPARQYAICTAIPRPRLIAEYTPLRLEYTKLLRTIMMKSGPGLITASRWMTATEKISVRLCIVRL